MSLTQWCSEIGQLKILTNWTGQTGWWHRSGQLRPTIGLVNIWPPVFSKGYIITKVDRKTPSILPSKGYGKISAMIYSSILQHTWVVFL
jgi:hypothetical protein